MHERLLLGQEQEKQIKNNKNIPFPLFLLIELSL
jgi:hypothetical protein